MEKSRKIELDPKGEFKGEVNLNETMRAMLDAVAKKERLYFDLLAMTNEYNEFIQKVTPNIIKMSMDDQIQLLKSVAVTGEICKRMAEKYDFDELCEEVE